VTVRTGRWTSGRSSGRQKDGSPAALWGQVGKQSGTRADVGEKLQRHWEGKINQDEGSYGVLMKEKWDCNISDVLCLHLTNTQHTDSVLPPQLTQTTITQTNDRNSKAFLLVCSSTKVQCEYDNSETVTGVSNFELRHTQWTNMEPVFRNHKNNSTLRTQHYVPDRNLVNYMTVIKLECSTCSAIYWTGLIQKSCEHF
jgi:hypothetical protein